MAGFIHREKRRRIENGEYEDEEEVVVSMEDVKRTIAGLDTVDTSDLNEEDPCSLCYECGNVCEHSRTFCMKCFDSKCQKSFNVDQKLQNLEDEVWRVKRDLEWERKRFEETTSDYRTMLLEGVFSDVTIETGDGDKTPAHRAVLASKSPVFRAMLDEEPSKEIRVADVPSAVMRELLLFMYTGKVQENWNGMELLAAAHKFELPKLKKACRDIISIRDSNVLDVLQRAWQYDAPELKEACLDFITREKMDVLFRDDFREFIMNNRNPGIILEIIQKLARY